MVWGKGAGAFRFHPSFDGDHFWRHALHPLRNIKARLRKFGPLNYTSKTWKAEHRLEDLKEKERFHEERLNKIRNRIRNLEAEGKKEA